VELRQLNGFLAVARTASITDGLASLAKTYKDDSHAGQILFASNLRSGGLRFGQNQSDGVILIRRKNKVLSRADQAFIQAVRRYSRK
jgi:hypothetical protein